MKIVKWAMITMLSATMGCATTFTGSPHVEGGRAGCEAKCKGQGMAVAGLVYMGEYSSACVCEVPRATGAIQGRVLVASTGAVSGAAAGVVMQMRNREQNRSVHYYGH